MTDCVRVVAILDVYIDDETSAETNAFVQQHVAHCAACARRLQLLREHRDEVRRALTQLHAPAVVHQRVRGIPVASQSSWAAFIREWLVPAAATVLVASIVVPWQPADPETDTVMAVAEHRACALEQAGRTRDASDYGPEAWVPLISDNGGRMRVVEAHTCGSATDFTHVIIEERGGGKTSILISRTGEGAERTLRPQTQGGYEVSGVRTTRHQAFVVIDQERSRALRAWREPTVERVHRFLKQLEGT